MAAIYLFIYLFSQQLYTGLLYSLRPSLSFLKNIICVSMKYTDEEPSPYRFR